MLIDGGLFVNKKSLFEENADFSLEELLIRELNRGLIGLSHDELIDDVEALLCGVVIFNSVSDALSDDICKSLDEVSFDINKAGCSLGGKCCCLFGKTFKELIVVKCLILSFSLYFGNYVWFSDDSNCIFIYILFQRNKYFNPTY